MRKKRENGMAKESGMGDFPRKHGFYRPDSGLQNEEENGIVKEYDETIC